MIKLFSTVVPCGLIVILWFPCTAQSAETPKREDKPLENSIGMKLVRIEPGSFQMGSEEGDADETPLRKVNISQPFYMGICEVTQEQYQKVMGRNPSRFKGDHRPVDSVSWDDAQAFCQKLSAIENAKYRLPTEAEWEYACRAGAQTKFYWGDHFDTNYFWCTFNAKSETRDVLQKQPNAWGLFDMSGNVWEWCSDWYSKEAYKSAVVDDPTGPTEGRRRVVRGGSCGGTPDDCRSGNRLAYSPDTGRDTIGFRVCMSIR